MLASWGDAFCEAPDFSWRYSLDGQSPVQIQTIAHLKLFLDFVHAKHCLLKPYFEHADYPLVESRELLPSFDADPFEYDHLPGFSMVALQRPVDYFQEIFQFDILHSILEHTAAAQGSACPLESNVLQRNVQMLLNRLPKKMQEPFKQAYQHTDITDLENYASILEYLLNLDRAQVMATDAYGNFSLHGVYASFPSDLDSEIKRFGLRIGKFQPGDNVRYELYRPFVYQFLMELYGFPIVSERRTSSALFARRLHKLGETFMVRVLGQSDRTITTLYSHPTARFYPRVEKLALVRVDKEQEEAIELLSRGGYFVDEARRVVLLRVRYRQHKYNPDNVRQDRALSVELQEVIHPLTGQSFNQCNIIKDTTTMFLRLNDIVRGEFEGRIIYKRHEVVENTDTDEKRLKFLYAWLSKHQRRIIAYSDEFFGKVVQVLDNYLLNPDNYDVFQSMFELYHEVWSRYSYIQQARKVRNLEDLEDGQDKKGKPLPYLDRFREAVNLLHDLKFEIVNYFDELVLTAIRIGERMVTDRYVIKQYIDPRDEDLTEYGRQVKRQYGRLVSLIDEFKAIRKSRKEIQPALEEVG